MQSTSEARVTDPPKGRGSKVDQVVAVAESPVASLSTSRLAGRSSQACPRFAQIRRSCRPRQIAGTQCCRMQPDLVQAAVCAPALPGGDERRIRSGCPCRQKDRWSGLLPNRSDRCSAQNQRRNRVAGQGATKEMNPALPHRARLVDTTVRSNCRTDSYKIGRKPKGAVSETGKIYPRGV